MTIGTEEETTLGDYDALYQQYIWLHGIVCILIEQEGGLVKIDQKTLEDYDLTTQLSLWRDEDDDTYCVRVNVEDA